MENENYLIRKPYLCRWKLTSKSCNEQNKNLLYYMELAYIFIIISLNVFLMMHHDGVYSPSEINAMQALTAIYFVFLLYETNLVITVFMDKYAREKKKVPLFFYAFTSTYITVSLYYGLYLTNIFNGVVYG